jgi:A/G-specific adenine glycosylase
VTVSAELSEYHETEQNPAEAIIAWYRVNRRDLPWRRTLDPYRIWISEVMLQQTRVDQAIPYYERFLQRFPDVQALALADIHDVLVAWEGLGYYSRGRNLHYAARQVVSTHSGVIPDTWDAISGLKGVGDYTAAAVLSIAYGKPYAVVDGNVIRVVTRYLGIRDDVRRVGVTGVIKQTVSRWIPADAPSDFNQGMMELGATVCTPKNPDCEHCPLADTCVARMSLQTAVIPYKSPKARVPHHQIVVGIIFDDQGRVLIARRPETAMLGGLWEFPGGKAEAGEPFELTLHRELGEELGVTVCLVKPFHSLNHAYSHFKITMHAYTCRIQSGIAEPRSSTELRWVDISELNSFPFPKANRTLTRKLETHFDGGAISGV